MRLRFIDGKRSCGPNARAAAIDHGVLDVSSKLVGEGNNSAPVPVDFGASFAWVFTKLEWSFQEFQMGLVGVFISCFDQYPLDNEFGNIVLMMVLF